MRESVAGLNVESPVEYNGVGVGSVKKIELNHKNPQLVEILLNIKSSTPITRGTVATVNTRGLTGMVYVALKDESSDLRKLKILPGQKYPVIKTAPSIFVRLDSALAQITKSFKQIADTFQTLLDQENLDSFKKILNNIRDVTNVIAANNKQINDILLHTSDASRRISPLIQSSANLVKVLETQTIPSTYELILNMNHITRNLNELSKELKQNPSILIRGVDRQSLGPGETK